MALGGEVSSDIRMKSLAGSAAMETPDNITILTKTRYIELVNIAKALCSWLEGKGVKHYEGCRLRQITETLYELKD